MKNQIMFLSAGIVLVIIGIFLFGYEGKSQIPVVGTDGKIDGNYAIEGIMRLGKPYKCTFEKTDGTSKILGIVRTDSKNVYGEFRIRTDLTKSEFNSFLIMKEGEAYIWTSLQNTGYKSPIAKSANRNASPQEQAQIVGMKDEIEYKCEPWLDVDNTVFETPTWVTFSELKK